MRVPNEVAQAADDMSKETRLPFRDCLDILMSTYLQKTSRRQPLVRYSGKLRIVRNPSTRVTVSCS